MLCKSVNKHCIVLVFAEFNDQPSIAEHKMNPKGAWSVKKFCGIRQQKQY